MTHAPFLRENDKSALQRVRQELAEVHQGFARLAANGGEIASAAELITSALRAGGKVMFCGNGGSAADSQHLAAELMGRYLKDRRPLAALALTVDTSALTAIGNDYGFASVFKRQLQGIGRAGDVLVGLSTSGRSQNVVAAMEAAKHMNITTIAFTGEGSNPMSDIADLAVQVPATKTNRIQEMHIAVGHIVCGLVEDALC